MRTEHVDIYSDTTNQAILRHPARRFPGVLIQGDTLKHLHDQVVSALNETSPSNEEASFSLRNVHEFLGDCLDHYRAVLRHHNIELPFVD